MDNIFQHLHMPAKLVCDFLAMFSRIEYALKSTVFAEGNNQRVVPAWDRFANEIDDQFSEISDANLQEAVGYLLGTPPRKQVLEEGQLKFIDQTIDNNQRSTQQLLLMVHRTTIIVMWIGSISPLLSTIFM